MLDFSLLVSDDSLTLVKFKPEFPNDGLLGITTEIFFSHVGWFGKKAKKEIRI